MGHNCSCTANQASKDHEIVAEVNHDEDHQGNTFKDGLQHKNHDQMQETRDGKTNAQKTMAEEKVSNEDQKMGKKIDKQKQAKKKRVKVMIPDNEIYPEDEVIFDPMRDDQISTIYYSQVIETLKKHFILSQLSSSELQYVVNKLKFCTSEAQTYIFKQGDKSFSYYIILEGECKVEINGKKIKTLTPGDAFGDLGIIYSAPRSASIYSVKQCLFAQLDRISFSKIINELNLILQRENRKGLQRLEFYPILSDLQKNALASSCMSEIYESGRIIFNKGDAANAYYVVQEGIVTILQNKIDLKPGDNLGINALLQDNATRSSTLIAKTRCKLLSITKSKIQQVLGDSITNIVNRKLVQKILEQSSIYDLVRSGDWDTIIQKMCLRCVEKNDIVLMKDAEYDSRTILIIIGTALKNNSQKKSFFPNTIIEESSLASGKSFRITQDFYAQSSGYFVTITCPKNKNSDGLFTISANSIDDPKGAFKINDFYVIRKLRGGNFGRVFACWNRSTQKKYALKLMSKSKLIKQKVLHYINKEQQVLTSIPKHPFIVRFYQTLEQDDMLIHVLNLIEGEDLFQILTTIVCMPDIQVRFYIKQLVLALEHLHKYKIVYRDLKPENIMLGDDGYLTLIDFGTAKKLTIENRYKTNTVIGTPHYMAPEIISGKGYTFSSDWWSLGVLAYELRTGKLPFGQFSDDPYNIYEQIHKKYVSYPSSVDYLAKQLIERLLSRNQQERWSGGYDDLKRLSYFSRAQWETLYQKKQKPSFIPGKVTKISDEEFKKACKRKNNKIKQVFEQNSMLESLKTSKQSLFKSNHK